MFLVTVVPGYPDSEIFEEVCETLEKAQAALQEVRNSGMFQEIREETVEALDQSYYWHESYAPDLSGFSDEIPF